MSNDTHTKNPEFLKYVYALTEGNKLNEALQKSLRDIQKLDISQLKNVGLKSYAEGKWTIHKILQHLIDWERIWCFRALILARREGCIPEAHDQEIMATHSNADERPLEDLIIEMETVRKATILLFESFDESILGMNCRFYEYEMPLFSIGLTIAAHQIHHFNIITERYLSLT